MFKKIDIKQISIIIILAIVFMSIFFILTKKIYVKKDTAFYTTTFSLKNNKIDTIKQSTIYSSIKSIIKFDTLSFDTLKSIKILPLIKIDTTDTELFLIISIEYNNKSVFWKSYIIQSQIKKLNKWQQIEQIQNFNNFYFDKDYIMKIYFWNKSKSKFFIKNIGLKLYSKPQRSENLIFYKN